MQIGVARNVVGAPEKLKQQTHCGATSPLLRPSECSCFYRRQDELVRLFSGREGPCFTADALCVKWVPSRLNRIGHACMRMQAAHIILRPIAAVRRALRQIHVHACMDAPAVCWLVEVLLLLHHTWPLHSNFGPWAVDRKDFAAILAIISIPAFCKLSSKNR